MNLSKLIHLGFPGGSEVKVSAHNAGDLGSIPGLGRSPGEGKGNPLQYSGLESSMDCVVQGVAKSQTRLSDFHFLIIRVEWMKPAIYTLKYEKHTCLFMRVK